MKNRKILNFIYVTLFQDKTTNKTPFYTAQHNVIFGLLNDLEKEINDPINKAYILNNLRLHDGINEESNQEKDVDEEK